jgi:hypothetical protein
LLTAHYILPRQQYGAQAAIDVFNQSLLSKLQAVSNGSYRRSSAPHEVKDNRNNGQ